MPRRKPYTKVEKTNFYRPAHVEGKGDTPYRGFQCINKDCTEYIFVESSVIESDFKIECKSCGTVHQTGDEVELYEYNLINGVSKETIEEGKFILLVDDYLRRSPEFKYCIICCTMKPLDYFSVHSTRKNTGRQGECRDCKDTYNGIKNQTRLTEQHREASQKRRLYTFFDNQNKLNINSIYDRFDSKCFKCGIDLSEDLSAGTDKKKGNLDHTLPVFYLWPLTDDNATLLCSKHNGEKSQKWPKDFYTEVELRNLSALTGIDYRILNGDPHFNPQSIAKLHDENFVIALFKKFAKYPKELILLRNRLKKQTDFDFFSVTNKISPNWIKRAEDSI